MRQYLDIVTAARAIDASTLAVRHWLAPGGVPLIAEPPRSGRTARRVAPPDLARLAIVATLLRYGLTVAEAAAVLARSTDPLLRRARTWPDTLAMLGGAVLLVSRESGGLAVSVADAGGRLFGSTHGPAALRIDPVEIARDAECRARAPETPAIPGKESTQP